MLVNAISFTGGGAVKKVGKITPKVVNPDESKLILRERCSSGGRMPSFFDRFKANFYLNSLL